MQELAKVTAEIERIRHHQDLQKKVNEENSKILNDIKTAIIGNDFNGHKGVVSSLKDIDNRVEDLEDFKGEINVYVRQFKFVVGAVVVILLGIFAKLFNLK
jgi:uncharacterized protein YPO0396